MKIKRILTIGFLSISAFTLHFAAQAEEETAEQAAFAYRTGVLGALKWKMGQLGAAKAQGDKSAFQKHANDLVYLSGMIEEGFIPNSLLEGSKAKPAVWENPEEFAEAAENLRIKAAELADADYDMASFDPRKFGGDTCGACHRKFKERD